MNHDPRKEKEDNNTKYICIHVYLNTCMYKRNVEIKKRGEVVWPIASPGNTSVLQRIRFIVVVDDDDDDDDDKIMFSLMELFTAFVKL